MGYSGLVEAVSQLRYKEGWRFRLQQGMTMNSVAASPNPMDGNFGAPWNAGGGTVIIPDWEPVTLVITVSTVDSSDRETMITVGHTFAAPPGTFAGRWERWLMHCIMSVETHEACEFFEVAGEKPFYPEHGPGGSLYQIREREKEGPCPPPSDRVPPQAGEAVNRARV